MTGPAVPPVSCPDRRGIVAAVSGFLAAAGVTIVDSQQFGDPTTGRFSVRVQVADETGQDWADAAATFAAPGGPAQTFAMDRRLDPVVGTRRGAVLATASR